MSFTYEYRSMLRLSISFPHQHLQSDAKQPLTPHSCPNCHSSVQGKQSCHGRHSGFADHPTDTQLQDRHTTPQKEMKSPELPLSQLCHPHLVREPNQVRSRGAVSTPQATGTAQTCAQTHHGNDYEVLRGMGLVSHLCCSKAANTNSATAII